MVVVVAGQVAMEPFAKIEPSFDNYSLLCSQKIPKTELVSYQILPHEELSKSFLVLLFPSVEHFDHAGVLLQVFQRILDSSSDVCT